MRPNLSFYNIVSREEKENIVKLREYKKFSRGQRLVSKGKPYPRKIKKKKKEETLWNSSSFQRLTKRRR